MKGNKWAATMTDKTVTPTHRISAAGLGDLHLVPHASTPEEDRVHTMAIPSLTNLKQTCVATYAAFVAESAQTQRLLAQVELPISKGLRGSVLHQLQASMTPRRGGIAVRGSDCSNLCKSTTAIRTKRVSLCSRGCPSEATYIYHATRAYQPAGTRMDRCVSLKSLESLCPRSF